MPKEIEERIKQEIHDTINQLIKLKLDALIIPALGSGWCAHGMLQYGFSEKWLMFWLMAMALGLNVIMLNIQFKSFLLKLPQLKEKHDKL